MAQFDYYLDSTNHQPVEVVIQLHQLVLDTILYYATLYAFTRGMQYKYLKPLDRLLFFCFKDIFSLLITVENVKST